MPTPRIVRRLGDLPESLQLRQIVTLALAEEITSLSGDSLKRNHPDKIRRLGPRRLGMQLADALAIADGTKKSA